MSDWSTNFFSPTFYKATYEGEMQRKWISGLDEVQLTAYRKGVVDSYRIRDMDPNYPHCAIISECYLEGRRYTDSEIRKQILSSSTRSAFIL